MGSSQFRGSTASNKEYFRNTHLYSHETDLTWKMFILGNYLPFCLILKLLIIFRGWLKILLKLWPSNHVIRFELHSSILIIRAITKWHIFEILKISLHLKIWMSQELFKVRKGLELYKIWQSYFSKRNNVCIR